MASNTVINTNVLAINAHRNLGMVGVKQSKASSKLSSGFRINSAGDDAAGLAISEKMRAQIRGLDQANRNTQDGISLIQTAEGGMQEIDNMLQRIRELVNQAANDTNQNTTSADGTGDRQKIQDEINQLVAEIDDMAERVEFNKKKVINGEYAKNPLGSVGKVSVGSLTDKAASLNNAIASMEVSNAGTVATMVAAYNSVVSALDTAEKNGTAVGIPLYFQVGANASQGISVNIESIKSDRLGIGNGKGTSIIDVRKMTGKDITGLLDRLDKALSHVTTERSKLGAAQNRMEYTSNSLQISSENLSAAESRVRDADMAKEMMNLTKANVLQQAATSMLAQANQAPQSVLQLLQ